MKCLKPCKHSIPSEFLDLDADVNVFSVKRPCHFKIYSNTIRRTGGRKILFWAYHRIGRVCIAVTQLFRLMFEGRLGSMLIRSTMLSLLVVFLSILRHKRNSALIYTMIASFQIICNPSTIHRPIHCSVWHEANHKKDFCIWSINSVYEDV
jgi:hypothetical protein